LEWDDGYRVVGGKGGVAVAERLPGPPCPFCGGVGRREIEIGGVLRVGKCRCQRVIDRIALFNAAGIPSRHAESTIESFKTDADGTRPARDVTRYWLDHYKPGGENKGMVLYGEPGRGKTHLLCGAVRELIFRYGVRARFIEFTHLLSRIREGIDRNDGEATTLTPLVDVPVLAIDELGKGRKTDWEQAIIDEIITRRYNAGGVLLGSTNFPIKSSERRGRESLTLALPGKETISERLGERVYSRMQETVQFVPAMGEDYRALKPGR
jgi:DNA replication protein DnaC